MAPFDWSHIQSVETLERSRAIRFRPEWRAILLTYLGLEPGMRVLEVCCGPGTFARYLAEGIAPGSVVGLDRDPAFIQRARAKAAASGRQNVDYVVGDAYALPFPDASFDAVTSYTGIGVLERPEAAVAEMIRVCRPGGTVSAAEAIFGLSTIAFAGLDALEESYPGTRHYHEIQERLRRGQKRPSGIGCPRWPPGALFGLLARSGLEGVRFNVWSYGQAPDDARITEDERRRIRGTQRADELARVAAAVATGLLTPSEAEEVTALTEARHRWLETAPAYDWEAGVSMVAAGQRPASP